MIKHLDLNQPQVREAIQELEQTSSIYTADRAYILLVADGFKPSMHTAIFSEPVDSDQPIIHVDEHAIKALLSIIKRLGLSYVTDASVFENSEYHYDRFTVAVSQDKAVAEALMVVKNKPDEREEGLLLGFPETAVDAFIDGEMLEIDDPRVREYLSVVEYAFLNHRLSKDNWKAEVDYIPTHVEAIKRLSPAIFEQITSA